MSPIQYADYNSYSTTAASAVAIHPYLLNQTYEITGSNEANMMDRLASEWYYLYGTDMVFLPRETNKEETTYGEYLSAVYEKGVPLRMFIEEVAAWSGNGDIYTKFGLQVTDEATMFCTKSFFSEQTSGLYPKQWDLIYVPKSHKLFQISHIEDEVQPAFYLLGNRAGYKIQCKLFMYNHEVISQAVSSGIPAAVQALDSLLEDMEGNQVNLETKEYNQNNLNIINNASTVINNDEVDPLTS